MATDYAGLTLKARAEVKDLVYSNPVVRESLGGDMAAVDSANVVFYLQYKNIVAGLVAGVQYGPWLTIPGSIRRSLGTANDAAKFALDALNGLVTMTTAPAAAAPPFVDYYFQWFQDAQYSYWIDQATQELAQPVGSFAPAVAGGGSLEPALIQYVAERFWKARASDFANKYDSSTAGASERIVTVTQNFLKLAQDAWKLAAEKRKNAYVDPGGKTKVASGTITYGMSKGTPRR